MVYQIDPKKCSHSQRPNQNHEVQACISDLKPQDNFQHHVLEPLDTVVQGVQTLGSTDTIFKIKPQPLNHGPIRHKGSKFRGIGSIHLHDVGEPLRCLDVHTNRPLVALGLPFLAEHEAVKQLGSLRMRPILENCGGLGPRYKLAFNGAR